MVGEPNFHDGYLDGVLVSGKDASLFLRNQDGHKFTIVLRQIFTLVMNDFRGGNIILTVDWIDPRQISDEGICEYFHEPVHKFSGDLRDRFSSLIDGKRLQGLEISPSYGATLTAVFEDREIKSGYLNGSQPAE